jgi:hypothetical protein
MHVIAAEQLPRIRNYYGVFSTEENIEGRGHHAYHYLTQFCTHL